MMVWVLRKHGMPLAAFVLACVAWMVCAGTLLAQQAAPAGKIEFQRVYVPENRSAEWPRSGFEFAPQMKLDEFENLVSKSAEVQGINDRQVPLRSLTYRAHVEGRLLQGTADFELGNSDTTDPGFVSLKGTNLLVYQPNRSQAAGAQFWVGEHDKHTGIFLKQPLSEVQLGWSYQMSVRSPNELSAELNLTFASQVGFYLELPTKWDLALRKGIVLSPPVANNEGDEPTRTWHLSPQWDGKLAFSLVSSDSRLSSDTTTATQSTRYQVQHNLCEVQSHVSLHSPPQGPFALSIPKELIVTRATVNGMPIEPIDLQETAEGQLLLETPAEMFTSGETAAVTVQGIMPLSIDDYSRIDLPIVVIDSLPPESHVVAVQLDEGIQLSYSVLKNAQQVEFIPHNSLGYSNLKFRLFDQRAQIGLQLFRPVDSRHTTLVHKATVNDLVIQSESTVHIDAGDEQLDHLELPLSPGWRVESVAQFPSLQAVGWEETTRDHQRVLRIENNSTLTDLQVSLRRTRENDFGNLRIEDFRPFSLPPGIGNTEWISVKPAAGFELRLEPSGLAARKSLKEVPAEIARLFGSDWQIPAFEIHGRSDLQHLLRVLRKRAAYDAEIDIQIQADGQKTRQLASIQLSGTGLPPETLMVWSTQPWSPEVKWTTPDLEPVLWTQITTADNDSNQRDKSYIYELHPPADSSFPLMLRGTFPVKSGTFESPLLLAAPSAETQVGTLSFTTPKATQVTADPILLRKIYSDQPLATTTTETTRYEYRPLEIRRLVANIRRLLVCKWQGTDALPDIFASRTNHSINIENDGSLRMKSVWEIVSQQPSLATINLPKDARVELVQWQGQPWSRWKQSKDRVEIEIPEAIISGDLDVHYRLDPGPFHLVRGVTPQFAVADFPTSTQSSQFILGSQLDQVSASSTDWSQLGQRMRRGLWSGMFRSELLDSADSNLVPLPASSPMPEGTIWVVQHDTLRLLSLIVLAFSLLIGATLFKVYPRAMLTGLLVLVVCVAWLPEVTAPLTSACFLGIILGGILGLLLVSRTHSDNHYVTAGSTVTVTSLCLALVASYFVDSLPGANAADPMAAPPIVPAATATKSTLYPVLIPVDSNRKPIGQAYLPLPLYERLNTFAQATDETRPGWIVEGMSYSLSLIDSVEPSSEIAVTTTTEVVTTKSNQTIRIPFDAQLGNGISTAVDQLDSTSDSGSILPNPYDAVTGELVLPLKEVGHHKIEIKSYIPITTPSTQPILLHIATPAEVFTAVTIADSMRMGSPKIEYADQEIALEASNIRQTIPLGMVKGFDLQWNANQRQTSFEFSELDLLEFTEDDVHLHVRLDLSNRPAQLGPILLNVDSRLTLDMQQSLDWTAEVKSTSVAAAKRTYSINLLEGAKPIESIEMRFTLNGAQQVGQLRYPNVEVLNGSLQRRWVAVSANSQLQVQSQAQSRVNILSQEEFLKQWKEEDPDFRFAVAVATIEPLNWLISTRPIATRGNADLRCRFQFDADGYDFDLKAQIETYSGQAKQYVVDMMPGSEVKSVQYLVDGLLRPTQWHYDPKTGELGVMLLTDMSGLQELSIHGRHWLSAEQREVTLHPIQIRDVHTQSCRVQMVRDHSVLIRPALTANLIPLQEESVELTDAQMIAVGQWELADCTVPIQCQIIPNEIIISGDLLTIANRVAGTWQLNWISQLDVRRGNVGHLQWLVPKDIDLDINSIEGFDVDVRMLPDQSAQVVTMVPRMVLGSTRELHWSGTLKTTPGRRVSFSPIRLIGQPRIRQFVAVPRQVEDQEVLWSSQELGATAVSERWLTANTPDTHQLLVANRPDYTCEMIQRANPTGQPTIDALETTIQIDQRGHAFGVSRVSVLPQGNNLIAFQLPPEVEILGAAVDYTRQWKYQRDQDGKVTLALKSSSLPQIVEIAFRSRLNQHANDQYELTRPSLVVPTRAKEILRVALAPNWRFEGMSSQNQMAWNRDQVLAAFDLKEASRDTQSGLGSQEIQRWNKLRMEQAFAALSRFQDYLRERNESPENTRKIISQLLGDNASDLETWTIDDGSRRSLASLSLMDATSGKQQTYLYFQIDSPGSPLSLVTVPSQSYWVGPPILVTLLALVAIGLMFVQSANLALVVHLARDWMMRNPQICGVLAGLFWWMYLPPHFIGLLLIAAVVWASLPIRSTVFSPRG
ncbi:hypothetical protein GC197_03995 [bacterium]|nr:hypothetical protein [bacterium]